jgi:hypothetical protein
MTPTGPLYCETGHPWLFMAEPVNTITNAFIIIAAIFALRDIRRTRRDLPIDLAILLFLLFATGVGSFFWHGFRTRVALAFDALPGLAFLFVFAGLWMRTLWGGLAGLLGALGLLGASVLSLYVGRLYLSGLPGMPPAIFLVPAYATVAFAGIILATVTAHRYGGETARLGAIALASAITAAVCRSIDLLMCGIVPFGTHFIWHILLSLSAYLGIAMLLRLKPNPA